jgi:hypothetical protein
MAQQLRAPSSRASRASSAPGANRRVERAQVLDRLAVPISFTGMPSSSAIASVMPPLAVPSSLVRTTPSTSAASEKTLRLAQPVLARSCVDRDQRLVRGVGHLLGDHPPHLGQLVHQVALRVQAAGGCRR